MKKIQQLSPEKQLSAAESEQVVFPRAEKQLADRIAQVIGEESQASFARRCGFGESMLRSYLTGTVPSALRISAIASAGNVSLDWLIDGRGPKARHAQDPVPQAQTVQFNDLARLTATITAVQEGLASVNLTLPPAKYAELVAAAYELMGGSSEAAPAQSAHVVRFIRAAAR